MSRPDNLHTRIFLDSGDPDDTRCTLSLLGFLDGQTTNPSLVAHNPTVLACLTQEGKCSKSEIHDLYKELITEISSILPEGDISIEVYAQMDTFSEHMMQDARDMHEWAENARIKFPTNAHGINAAIEALKEGMKVNMTLVFSQAQAAAIHAATKGAQPGQVIISPFIGRLDDAGLRGFDLVENCMRMYREAGSHVQVLAASIRSEQHLQACFASDVDIVTAPTRILEAWGRGGMVVAKDGDASKFAGTEIEYVEYDLTADWKTFDITHPLTDAGVTKFAAEWDNLIGH